MATLSEIRARVRLRLEEASAAVWSDAELDEGITATLEEYSERFPREATTTAAVAADATNTAMPAGARSVLRVSLESGAVVPRRGAPVGQTSDERLAWEAFAGTLWFTRPLPAQTLTVWYLASHAIADVPDADAGLLALGGVWRALEQRGVQELKRSGPAAGLTFVQAVHRARQEYERAFDQRARRLKATLPV